MLCYNLLDEAFQFVLRNVKNTEESSEDIKVVLADKKEVQRILKEENVSMMCAYMLLHFLKSEGNPLGFIETQDK